MLTSSPALESHSIVTNIAVHAYLSECTEASLSNAIVDLFLRSRVCSSTPKPYMLSEALIESFLKLPWYWTESMTQSR